MYKNSLVIFSFILIISAVYSQSSTDIAQSNPTDINSQSTHHNNIDSKELPINQGHVESPTIYSTFIPQDAVQQYVSQYGTGYSGQALEGFLIPTLPYPAYERAVDYEPQPNLPSYLSIFRTLLPAPKLILTVLLKIISVSLVSAGVLFFGTLICTLTPICSPTLAIPALLRKETKEIVEKIGEEITPERIKRAADLFSKAIAKYQNIQKQL